MVTVGLTFLFNMVSVVHHHFKGHRLLKGTQVVQKTITVGLVQGW